MGVYGGVLVRNTHGNLYLSMDMATESKVADTECSTATGAPLTLNVFLCVPSHNKPETGKGSK
jgi:hypothetical protein